MSRGVHKVGLTAAVIGLSSLVLLPFATVRTSRIQTGASLPVWRTLGTGGTVVLVLLWLVLCVLAVRDDRRPLPAAARGLTAAAVIASLAVFSELGAKNLLAQAGQFARVSIGGGVWAGALAAYAVVLASRREVGTRTPLGFAVTAAAPAAIAGMLTSGFLADLGMMREYANQGARFWSEVVSHITLSAVSVVLATALGLGLGLLAFRFKGLAKPLFAVVSVFQTIPGLAMIGLLVAPLSALSFAVPELRRIGFGGLGWAPVVTALTLYALLSVVRNTYAGVSGVPPETVDAAAGMGMTRGQVVRRVRLPLAAPVVFGGVRTAAVQTVGNATLGAFAAAGTLGLFVFGGLSQQSPDLIMLGSIAVVLLALAADGLMRVVQTLVTPRRRRVP